MNYPEPQYAPTPPSPKPASALAGIVLLVLVFVVGLAVGQTGFFGGGAPYSGSTNPTPAPTTSAGDLHGMDLFWQAVGVIRQNYVGRDELDDQTLVYGAIRGLVDALGDTQHSVFLTPQDVQESNNALNLSVVGIGVTVGQNGDQIVILSVIPGSPAQAAGLHAGDVFVSVDSQSVQGQTIEQVVSRVRGDAGTRVELTMARPSTGETVDVTIVRQELHVPAAWWSMVPGTTTADLRLASFGQGSAADLQAARDAAIAAGATSLILDLRANPGGYVDEAINVASEFLTDKVVYIDEDANKVQTPKSTNPDISASDLPLVVLINSNTASAAEIVSGAIQSAGRAQLVGATTFGTGTVLRPFPLSDGSQIHLATQRWLTPAGDLIFGKGITPDVAVPLGPTDVPVSPDELDGLTADQVAALKDPQLLRALQLLGARP
ncbi:MAG: S41 family peptidase [Chloroflexota bacterium]